MKRFAMFAFFFAAGCTPSSQPVIPGLPPSPSPTPAVAVATTSGTVAVASADDCPPAGADEREHCVWLKGLPGVSGIELSKRLQAAGFPAEVEGEKVYAWWKADRIERFFGVKPGYVRSGGSSGGTVCLMILPKGAKPILKSSISGWAIDDPVCEM